MFVYIRVSPNNPINARAPSLGLRLSFFSEVTSRSFAYDVSRPYGVPKQWNGGHTPYSQMADTREKIGA